MKSKLLIMITLACMLVGCKNTNEITNTEIYSQQKENTELDFTMDEPQTNPSNGEVEQRTMTFDSPYRNTKSELHMIGFEASDQIETEKFIDTPKEGNCFLVLYLSVMNYSTKEIYMHPDDLTAKVDGQEIDHTFLINDPKGYVSFFQNIRPDVEPTYCYIVWEVPKDWSCLEIKFRQWEHTDGVTLDATLTPEDYLEAELVKDLQI